MRNEPRTTGGGAFESINLSRSRSLLLNASFEPMKIVCWQKAIILWFQGKVEILEYHPLIVRSSRLTFQVPSVLRLKSYVRPRPLNRIRFSRENVYIRDNFTCQYCGNRMPGRDLTLDHVVPASKNGAKTWNNVVAACRPCNQKKGNRTPHAARMPLLKEPATPSWLPLSNEELPSVDIVPESWRPYLNCRLEA